MTMLFSMATLIISLHLVRGYNLSNLFFTEVDSGGLTVQELKYSEVSSGSGENANPICDDFANTKAATVWGYFSKYSTAVRGIAATWIIVNNIMDLITTPIGTREECNTKKIKIQGQAYWYILNGTCTAMTAQNTLNSKIHDTLFALSNRGQGIGCIRIISGDYWGYVAISPDDRNEEFEKAVKHCDGYVIKHQGETMMSCSGQETSMVLD